MDFLHGCNLRNEKPNLYAAGYCTFSGLSIAVIILLTQHATKRVGILDLDSHSGDGTEAKEVFVILLLEKVAGKRQIKSSKKAKFYL